jgi:hypothetical protein
MLKCFHAAERKARAVVRCRRIVRHPVVIGDPSWPPAHALTIDVNIQHLLGLDGLNEKSIERFGIIEQVREGLNIAKSLAVIIHPAFLLEDRLKQLKLDLLEEQMEAP